MLHPSLSVLWQTYSTGSTGCLYFLSHHYIVIELRMNLTDWTWECVSWIQSPSLYYPGQYAGPLSFRRLKQSVSSISLKKDEMKPINLYLLSSCSSSHGGGDAVNQLRPQQWLNPSYFILVTSVIHATLLHYARIIPQQAKPFPRLSWPNHRLWYKSSYSTFTVYVRSRRKPQRSSSFHRHQRNQRALLSLSLTVISQPCHSLSTGWAYLGHETIQLLGGGSCSGIFQRPRAGKSHHSMFPIILSQSIPSF